jgi:hypothetical protein
MIKNSLLLVALASLISVSACKKDDKKEATEPAAKTTETPATDKKADHPAAGEAPKADHPAKTDEAPADDKAAAGDMNREEVATKAIALFTKMNETVKAGAGDCDKIGADLGAVITEGKDVMEARKAFDEDPEAKKWFDETHGETIKVIMTEMMGGLSTCMDNEAVKKAFEGME